MTEAEPLLIRVELDEWADLRVRWLDAQNESRMWLLLIWLIGISSSISENLFAKIIFFLFGLMSLVFFIITQRYARKLKDKLRSVNVANWPT